MRTLHSFLFVVLAVMALLPWISTFAQKVEFEKKFPDGRTIRVFQRDWPMPSSNMPPAKVLLNGEKDAQLPWPRDKRSVTRLAYLYEYTVFGTNDSRGTPLWKCEWATPDNSVGDEGYSTLDVALQGDRLIVVYNEWNFVFANIILLDGKDGKPMFNWREAALMRPGPFPLKAKIQGAFSNETLSVTVDTDKTYPFTLRRDKDKYFWFYSTPVDPNAGGISHRILTPFATSAPRANKGQKP
jgi:hypothetical protein